MGFIKWDEYYWGRVHLDPKQVGHCRAADLGDSDWNPCLSLTNSTERDVWCLVADLRCEIKLNVSIVPIFILEKNRRRDLDIFIYLSTMERGEDDDDDDDDENYLEETELSGIIKFFDHDPRENGPNMLMNSNWKEGFNLEMVADDLRISNALLTVKIK
jgi:hypothetical protein